MTLDNFLEYVKTRKALDTEDIHRFMDEMSNEARRITFKLNASFHAPDEVRALLSELFGKPVPPSLRVFPPFYTDFGKNIEIGNDVFINACHYMIEGLNAVTNSQGIKLTDLKFIASHQANKRIMATVARQIDFPEDRMLSNIEEVGNTGCPSCAIALSQNLDRVDHGDLVALSVFGGGYSCGAVLLQFL